MGLGVAGAERRAVPAFALVERRVAGRGGSPIVSAGVLRAPGMLAGAAALFLALINYAGYLFSMALHLQSGLGDSPAKAGLVFAPAAIGFALTGLTWRRLPARHHGHIIPIGLVAAAAFVLLGVILRGGGEGGVAMEADLLLLGLALGLAFSPILTVALTHVPVGCGRGERPARHGVPTRPGRRRGDAGHAVPVTGARAWRACVGACGVDHRCRARRQRACGGGICGGAHPASHGQGAGG